MPGEEQTWEGTPSKARVWTPLEKLWSRPQGDKDVCWFTWAGAGLRSLGKQDATV